MINIINNCKLGKNNFPDFFDLFDKSLDYSYEEAVSIFEYDCFMFSPLLLNVFFYLRERSHLVECLHVGYRKEIEAIFGTTSSFPIDVYFKHHDGNLYYDQSSSLGHGEYQQFYSCRDSEIFSDVFLVAHELHESLPFIGVDDWQGEGMFDVDWVCTYKDNCCFRINCMDEKWALACFKTDSSSLSNVDYPFSVLEVLRGNGEEVTLKTTEGSISFSCWPISLEEIK